MELAEVLREGMSRGASDFHLKPRQHPVLRAPGQLVRLENWPLLEPKDLEQMAGAMMNPTQRERFEREGGVDVQYSVAGIGRFRASICRARGSTSIALRVVPYELPTFEELNLPPIVAKLAMEPRGLDPGDGPGRSGKTTTLAAMINHMNHQRADHIVTIEDPIEYLLEDGTCIITQREVGMDAPVRRRAADLPPPGPGRGHGRRDAGRRDDADGADARRDRPPGALDAPHDHRRRDGQPDHRRVPRRTRAADPPAALPGPEGRHLPAAHRARPTARDSCRRWRCWSAR